MAVFLTRRIVQGVVVLLLVSFAVFVIMHLLPGDPARVLLGIEATTAEVTALRRRLGLDQPLLVQYGNWLGNVLQGDLGQSLSQNESVAHIIAARLPITLELGVLAMVIGTAAGIPAGVLAAVKRGSWIDSSITTLANLGIAVPIFWLSMFGVYIFSLKLNWLPVQGYTSPLDNLGLSIRGAVMPVALLALAVVAFLARQTRSAMLEVLNQDYIRTARSKGLKESAIIWEHALRNAMIPVLSLLGLLVPIVVGGSVFVERIFNIPGMGWTMANAVVSRDIVLLQGCVLVVATAITVSNIFVDILYATIDPRIRLAQR